VNISDLTETVVRGLLTGLAADALWEGDKWAWNHREEIMQTLRRQPMVKQASGVIQGTSSVTAYPIRITVTDNLGITDNATSAHVEGPTRSLARRLEDLASWYLYVSYSCNRGGVGLASRTSYKSISALRRSWLAAVPKTTAICSNS
jgi:hypothetical protein